jgi:hypothetical protein
VITHLVGLVGSTVRVTLEIEAEIPAGAETKNRRTQLMTVFFVPEPKT